MARRHARLWAPGSQQDNDARPRPVRATVTIAPEPKERLTQDPRSIARKERCLLLALEEDGVVFVRGLISAFWPPEEWRAMCEAPSYRVTEVFGQSTVVFPFVQ